MKTAKEVCDEVKVLNKKYEDMDLNNLIELVISCRGYLELSDYSQSYTTANDNIEKLEKLGFKVTRKTLRIDLGKTFFCFGKTKYVYEDIIIISACCGEKNDAL